jgi:hypothetical protein
MLALKCFSVDQLAIWPFDYLNSAMSTTLQEKGLNNCGLSAEACRLGVMTVGVSVADPPVGHF